MQHVGNGADERTPFEVLLGDIDHILGEWKLLLRPQSWAELPAARLIDSMPEILPKLVRLAGSGASHIDEELQQRIADHHGWARREDDVPIEAVTSEWASLKRACRQILARNGILESQAEEVMARLDVLIDDAVGFTLRGYYRDELDSLKGRGLERRGERHDRRAGGSDRRGHNGEE
jgi:hypothetical protein